MNPELQAAEAAVQAALRAERERLQALLDSYEHQLRLQGLARQSEMLPTAFEDGALAAVRVLRAGLWA